MSAVEGPRQIDPTERAHLKDPTGATPPIVRFAPRAELAEVVRRFWLPIWNLPPGAVSVQRVLQYPVCLIVVSDDYSWLVGPSTGLSTRRLSGSGWAVGTMLQPAAGALLRPGPVGDLTDGWVDLDRVPGIAGAALTTEIRTSIGARPDEPGRQRAAVEAVERALLPLLPLDAESHLINAVVDYVDQNSSVQRVAQICEKFALTERTLQRITARRLGLSPKWLVQRRRLHEAAERLSGVRGPDLARVAAELGYADQAHFGRDFRAVTGLTPGQFAAEPRRGGRTTSSPGGHLEPGATGSR